MSQSCVQEPVLGPSTHHDIAKEWRRDAADTLRSFAVIPDVGAVAVR